MSEKKNVWISGGSSEIAQSLIQLLNIQPDVSNIIVLSRNAVSINKEETGGARIIPIQLDWLTEDAGKQLTGVVEQYPPHRVFCCNGILHDESQMPEKNLKAMNLQWLHHSLDANVWPHIALAQIVERSLTRQHDLRWISLSAMVGSISDNQLGGWYSYRMTKAALNMLIKNLSIEWQRKSPKTIAVAVHPGTTDTRLSEPFQKNIQPGKLYSADLTAQRMLNVMEHLTEEDNGKLLHWDGSVLPW
ncbi:SDR family NAD(P)-dependent oxidoreductase [Bacterioplanoides sp. SCSIO 12839]|uniref:SDR family NAD(P)-dependent oxidoreductase n=1 Tax=Bacterioplanoides sp. SCSIO 12839 TaxID=2829569 RepID=UPI00210400F6|nr:SDR family NAD(P)-dependent oxidoreductase [Bacterioplanoides sp. SCSIO 12839]UTW49632.1 SDR family NAD(P)-dependent oxidoreductase [Bacterioplanoides sp. SCSIO 12839]